MRRGIVLFALCAFALGVAHAGKNLKDAKRLKPIIDDGIERAADPAKGSYVPGLDRPMSLNWVVVDSMANAFGPANDQVKPMAYDPITNVLAVIHRGGSPYALGSGQLWYNVSHDAGATWRRAGELNGGSPISCRYPSVAISNPGGVNDTDQCLLVYSAPNLENAGGFGQITYGADFPLGGGNGFGTVDVGSNLYTAATTIWTERANPWIIWASTELGSGVPNNSTNWRTSDYISVPRTTPPTWRDTLPNFINALGFVVGSANASGSYFCVNGLFGGDDSANAFNDGYCKSTDHGATWGPWIRPQPDWMVATGLPTNLDLYDYYQADGPGTTVSYTSDMLVDGNNRVHFFLAIADSPWTAHANRHLIEIYETGAGWSYKWIKQNLNTYTGLGYPGSPSGTVYLDQTNNAQAASISADGQVMTLVWLDAATSAPADSFPDIWFSYRTLNSSAWSTPVNLTQTPGFPELLLHAAPIIKSNGGNSYTLFLGRSYQTGINTYPPDNGVKTTFFVSAYTFNATSAGVGETSEKPATFRLEQNYPNPFNPSTSIRYAVQVGGQVTLKVFNAIGQEVATLVDGYVSPGEHTASFDASKFSSGVYVYRMTSGSQIQSRKMLLVK